MRLPMRGICGCGAFPPPCCPPRQGRAVWYSRRTASALTSSKKPPPPRWTLQVKPSAFDRVNVRRLFLRLERAAYQVARYFVYEPNTSYTRQRLIDALNPYFKEAKDNGGVYDYKIRCDEVLNDDTTWTSTLTTFTAGESERSSAPHTTTEPTP